MNIFDRTSIVLVNPPLTGEERYGRLAGGGVYMPPLGLANLAAFIRKEGYSVKIVDCCALNLNLVDSVKTILSHNPEAIGITAATVSINKAADLATMLKKERPGLKVIVGGCHISALPEKTMNIFPQFDMGVVGEGELATVELLKSFGEKRGAADIPGVIFREGDDIKMNIPRPFIKDLDMLPFPAWDLLPDIAKFYRPSCFGFKRLPASSLITLRGCPMRCTFCSEMPFAKTCRMHSPEYVIEMIKLLTHQYGIKEIMFYDGTFVINQERVINLCELILKHKLDIAWSCNGRIDLMTRPLLRLMRRAGCWSIAYGIESGSQKVLDFIKKDIDLDKSRAVLKWTKEERILTKAYFMIGHLIENESTIHDTMDFIFQNEIDILTLNYFTPLPGTLDYERAREYGDFNDNWSLLNHHNMVFVPSGLKEDIMRFHRQYIVRKFYLRPNVIMRYAKIFFNLKNFKIILLGFLAFMKFSFFNEK